MNTEYRHTTTGEVTTSANRADDWAATGAAVEYREIDPWAGGAPDPGPRGEWRPFVPEDV